MTKQFVIIILFASVSLAAPLAGATWTCDPSGTVCAGETHVSYGSCESGAAQGFTGVRTYSAAAVAVIGAGWSCFGYPGYFEGQSSFIGMGAMTPAGRFDAGWSAASYDIGGQTYEYCFMGVMTPAGGHNLGCPAGGPPAMPWGQLLP